MHWPSLLTWYKKPEYRDVKEYAAEVASGRRAPSPDGRGKTSIPSRLKLERVLENKTCSPMSLYDFHMYLKYIELSPENLEFYIWFGNYQRAWQRNGGAEVLDEKDSFLSTADGESTISMVKTDRPSNSLDGADFAEDIDAAEAALSRITDFIGGGPSRCATGRCELPAPARPAPSRAPATTATLKKPVKAARTSTTPVPAAITPVLKPQPSLAAVTQRSELCAVIRTFLQPGADKELNIPPGMRNTALAALQHSSDPTHLQPIADHVYLLLKNCSHRNFVRLGVGNGTFETVCMATGLGIVLTCAGVLLSLLLACGTPRVGAHSRWNAFAAWPLWWLGISLILSGVRGSCFFLLLFTRRQPLPWERLDDAGSVREVRMTLWRRVSRLMIFDRKFTVEDRTLRRLQHKIVFQSLFGGAVFASFGVIFFFLLPVWNDSTY